MSAPAVAAVEQTSTEACGLLVRAIEKGAGPPIVVLHHSFGAPGWAQCYERLSADHRVLAPDLPGYGDSERPDWARHPRDLAIVIGDWMRARGVAPAAIVGCGFGGWVAAELSTMAPELISKLVLVGAAGLLPRSGQILDQIMVNHSRYLRAAFSEQASHDAVFGVALTDDLLLRLDVCREMTTRIAWKPYMYSRQLAAVLPSVKTPTLVVWGERDEVVPFDSAAQFVDLLGDARLEKVAACGHAVDLEQPERLAELVRDHLA